jgi:type VI secretion system secreted protein Hcp
MRKGKAIYYWPVALLLVFCLLAPASALAQIRIFVNFGDIKGESTDKDHKDWVDAFSYGDGVSQGFNPAYSSPGGSAAMRADFAPITIAKQIDAASPKLREAAAKGTHLPQVTIELYEGQFKFFVVKLKEVMISSVQAVMPDLAAAPALTAASSPSVLVLQEKVSFVYGAIEWTYTKQKPDGSAAGNVTAKWNLQMNRAQ